MIGVLTEFLARAQRAGAVRGDVDPADVEALITGCLARTPDPADPAAPDLMSSIARRGLQNALPARDSRSLATATVRQRHAAEASGKHPSIHAQITRSGTEGARLLD